MTDYVGVRKNWYTPTDVACLRNPDCDYNAFLAPLVSATGGAVNKPIPAWVWMIGIMGVLILWERGKDVN